MRDLNLPKLGSKQLRNSSIVPLGYARSPASRMSPSKRSNSRDSGPSAGDPHQPVSPSTFTQVVDDPGGGMTGGGTGVSVAGSGVGVVMGFGLLATGTLSMVCCGAVGEPPPHWLNAIALPK